MKYSLIDLEEKCFSEPFSLLCSSSFEKRCLSLPRIAVPSTNCVSCYVCVNEENLRYVGSFAKQIEEIAEHRVERVHVWGTDPVRSADSIFASVRELLARPVSRVFVDISAMMRETLLIVLASLRRAEVSEERVRFLYVPAEYNPTRSQEARPQLSFDVLDVRSVLGYPGEYMPTASRHLILLAGFEVERAKAVVQATEPSVISIGHGEREHSTSPMNAELDQRFASSLMRDYAHRATEFEIYPDEAIATANAIGRQIERYSSAKPLVCAMNTKISTCGAAVAAWRNPTVELLYAQPALYNFEDYSEPRDSVYVFDLPISK